ncbi:hypothetical protein [Oceanobacillus sp. FSL H7-0719]|uniref:hypothetical protein n=1 Tax=Oceanobacillus sp. FSL H7-0719 TaxID=2954507 RepID=UPI003246B5DC
MNNTTKYVGLDVSKENIAVAVADEGRSKPRYIGMISYSVQSIRKLMNKLGKPEQLHVCYEAGPTGYGLYRLLNSMDIECRPWKAKCIRAAIFQRSLQSTELR